MTEVRHDIPFPFDQQPQKPGRKSKHPFDSLEVGASFPVGTNGLKNIRSLASRRSCKDKKFKVARVEIEGDIQWRCWRIA